MGESPMTGRGRDAQKFAEAALIVIRDSFLARGSIV
jgi:hypothetical protein